MEVLEVEQRNQLDLTKYWAKENNNSQQGWDCVCKWHMDLTRLCRLKCMVAAMSDRSVGGIR